MAVGVVSAELRTRCPSTDIDYTTMYCMCIGSEPGQNVITILVYVAVH